MTRALEYIQQNYKKDLSLDMIADKLGISPYYFCRLFKEEMGVNFVDYLTELRVKRAKELLREEGHSMKEICSGSGYSDPSYFSRIFKKRVGVTPTEYQEQARG